MALDGCPTRYWHEEFFSALSLVLVSLGQYVPCGDCSAQLFVFQRFQRCLKLSPLIPISVGFSFSISFEGIPSESYALIYLIIY